MDVKASAEATPIPEITPDTPLSPFFVQAKDLLFSTDPDITHSALVGRIIAYLFFFIWGWNFILAPQEIKYGSDIEAFAGSYMHTIDVWPHSFGHSLFSSSGRFAYALGGNLVQLAVPLICMCALLIKERNAFGASFALWWLAQNFMDIAPYINDARAGFLRLLAAESGLGCATDADWKNILKPLGLLRFDHSLAHLSYNFGILLMILAFTWGGYVLYLQYKNLHRVMA